MNKSKNILRKHASMGKTMLLSLGFILVSFFSAFGDEGHAEIDSLLELASHEPNDSIRLNYYWDLSYYYQPVDTVKMWYYYDTAIALATQLNNLNALAGVNIDMGNRYMYEGDYVKSEQYTRKAISIASTENNVRSMLVSWLNIAVLYSNKSDYKRQIEIVDSCLAIGLAENYTNIIVGCYQLKGNDFWRIGDMDSTSFYLFETLKLAEEQKLTNKITEVHNSLGQMYFELEEYQKALDHLTLALTSSYYIVGTEYHYMGKVYFELGNDSLAEIYYDSALIASKNHTYYDLQAGVLNSIGLLQANSKERYNEAISSYFRALNIVKSSGQEWFLSEIYLNLSKVYLLKNNSDSSLYYGYKSVVVAKDNEEKENKMNGYAQLSEIYKTQGELDSALYYFERFHVTKDSVLNETKLKNISEMELKYEAAKKDLKIQQDREKLLVLESDKKELINEMVLGIVLLVLIFGALFAFLRVRSTKSEKKLQEKFTQDVIESQEVERKRISRDLHDSIGQNLLLILRDEAVAEKTKLNSLVGETLEEVRTISRDLHPVQLERLGITQAIEEMVDKCDKAGDMVCSDEIDSLEGLFSPSDEINLYRIVQECLTNVLKHSKAKASRLEMKVDGSVLRIRVVDNGVGSKNLETGEYQNSLGLITLKERTKYLSGNMRIKSSATAGTSVTFVIPIHKNERS